MARRHQITSPRPPSAPSGNTYAQRMVCMLIKWRNQCLDLDDILVSTRRNAPDFPDPADPLRGRRSLPLGQRRRRCRRCRRRHLSTTPRPGRHGPRDIPDPGEDGDEADGEHHSAGAPAAQPHARRVVETAPNTRPPSLCSSRSVCPSLSHTLSPSYPPTLLPSYSPTLLLPYPHAAGLKGESRRTSGYTPSYSFDASRRQNTHWRLINKQSSKQQ